MSEDTLNALVGLLRQAVAQAPLAARPHLELGKALLAAGRPAEACPAFERAQELDPAGTPPLEHALAVEAVSGLAAAKPLYGRALSQKGARFPSLTPLPDYGDWSADMARAALARCRDFRAIGIARPEILAAEAVALHRLGLNDQLAALLDFDRLFRIQTLPAPPGYDSLAAFNRALAAEIGGADLQYYDAPDDRSIRHARRRNDMTTTAEPACAALRAAVARAVAEYAAGLPESGHVVAEMRPAEYRIESWAVVSQGEGRHLPHIHPRGWINAVYYVERPPSAYLPGGLGRLHVGPPVPAPDGEPTAWPQVQFDGEPGLLLIMPAYYFHWTLPTGLAERRICVAFDVIPTVWNG